MFLVRSFDDKSQQCFLSYPEEWIIKARETAWLVLTVVPLLIMIGLYYRVVHLLWFKNCGGDSQFSSKQKVRPGLLNVLKGTVVQRRREGMGVGVGGGVLQGNPVLPAELTKRIGHPKADVSSVSPSSDSHRRKANAHASALESFYGGQFTL